MILYKLTVTKFIEYEYEEVETHFYRTESEMQQDCLAIEENNKRDGKWIPNITSVDFDSEEIDFEDAKDEMTITQFEDLFDTVVFAE
jgi:hypothetical protein